MLHKKQAQQQQNVQSAGPKQPRKLIHQRVITKGTIQAKGRKAEQKQQRNWQIQQHILPQRHIHHAARQHIEAQPISHRQQQIDQQAVAGHIQLI